MVVGDIDAPPVLAAAVACFEAASALARKSKGSPAEKAMETGRREREGANPLRVRSSGSAVGVGRKEMRPVGAELTLGEGVRPPCSWATGVVRPRSSEACGEEMVTE